MLFIWLSLSLCIPLLRLGRIGVAAGFCHAVVYSLIAGCYVVVIQDFQVSVTPIGNHQYLVRTERVASGVLLAEEQLSWPVDGWLRQARHLMTDPLLGVLAASVLSGDEDSADLALSSSGLLQLGHQLYQALFTKGLRDSWVAAQGIAHNRGELLRLRLGLKGDELLALPWEVMNDGDRTAGGAIFQVATGANVTFSRYHAGVSIAPRMCDRALSGDQLLRMLVVTSAPNDREQMALRREVEYLRQELQSGVPPSAGEWPGFELTVLDQPDRTQLTQALEQGRYQVLHYAGHSNLGVQGGDLHLVNRETGLTESLSGHDLAGLLVNNGIRLVVLNSCHGAQQSTDDGTTANRNLAEAIVRRGVPAVLAMAEQIPDNVALTLTQLFYRNIRQGYAIDRSLSRARQGLMVAHGSNRLYWALPVLYLHPEDDGCLFVSDRTRWPLADPFIEDDGVLPDFSGDEARTEPLWEQGGGDRLVGDSLESDNFPIQDELLDDLPAEKTAQQIATLYEELAREQPAIEADNASAEHCNDQPDQRSIHHRPDESGSKESVAPIPYEPAEPAPGSFSSWELWGTKWQPIVIGMSVAAIAFVGIRWALQSQDPDPPLQPPTVSEPETDNSQLTDEGTGAAIQALQSGDLEQAETLLTQFLENGNLAEFDSALQAIPQQYLDEPAINFLRGRFVWQSIQDEGQADDFNAASARLLWRAAIAAQPNIEYLNALGMSYAVDEQWLEALESWLRALEAQGLEPIAQIEADGWINGMDADDIQLEGLAGDRHVLTTYAGLAMALWVLAEEGFTESNQTRQLAIALKRSVQQQSPADFELNSLQTNWLWTDELIEQWQAIQP